MDTWLLGPGSPLGYPAPYWFLLLFKMLGFSLHMVPMGLWYAGLVTMMVVRWRGGEQGRILSGRVVNALPIAVALGINLGIVPLLFTQVVYHQVFYPATILMAWPWFGVILLLMGAYYGLYYYVVGLRTGKLTRARLVVGWASSVLFVGIGFLFANAFSLMTRVGAWRDLWEATSIAGAPLGIALNVADATLWPRWLMMFGLALTTTAAYIFLDAGVFAGRESQGYRAWARRFAFGLYTMGIVWFALAGTWYIFEALPASEREMLFRGAGLGLTALTALAPGAPWILMLALRGRGGRGGAIAVAAAQFVVLALNAVSRQSLQNIELAPFLAPAAVPVNIQWSPLILFLLLFVGGLALVVWMVAQAVRAARRPEGSATAL
jgi:hypothetical protein